MRLAEEKRSGTYWTSRYSSRGYNVFSGAARNGGLVLGQWRERELVCLDRWESERYEERCGLRRGKDGKSHWDTRQKAKAQFSLALTPIFAPSLPACYMRTCNDISRRWDGRLGGTLSWARKIRRGGGGGINLPPRLVTQHSCGFANPRPSQCSSINQWGNM